MEADRWSQVPIVWNPERYVQLPYTGWFLMLAWAAGPEKTARRPGTLQEAVASEDELGVDAEVDIQAMTDQYLKDAGIPPVPPGFVWFLALPEGIDTQEELWSRLDAAARAAEGDNNDTQDGRAYVTEAFHVYSQAISLIYGASPRD